MKNRAFTLLELLIVITIIGILSSIVIVSMSGSTDSADIAKGKSYSQQVHALLGHEAVLDLNFNENAYNTCSDGSDACDASGYSNHGTIVGDASGATFVSSPIDGYSLYFDGDNDYVDLARNPIENNVWTIAMWFNIENSDQYDMLYSGPDNTDIQLFFHMTTKYLSTSVENVERTTTFKISDHYDEWHHAVWTHSASNLTIVYIDGVVVLSSTDTTYVKSSESVRIGQLPASSAYDIQGYLDDVRVYAQSLSSTEIQKQYAIDLKKLFNNGAVAEQEYEQRLAFLKRIAKN